MEAGADALAFFCGQSYAKLGIDKLCVRVALQEDALGPQDAGHAADAIGRRVIGCPESPSFAPSLGVEWK